MNILCHVTLNKFNTYQIFSPCSEYLFETASTEVICFDQLLKYTSSGCPLYSVCFRDNAKFVILSPTSGFSTEITCRLHYQRAVHTEIDLARIDLRPI